jgi:hypothetical protein
MSGEIMWAISMGTLSAFCHALEMSNTPSDASRFSFSIIFSTAIDGRTPNQHVLVRDYCARGATVTKTAARHAFAVVDVQLRNTMFGSRQSETTSNYQHNGSSKLNSQ